FQNMDPSLTGRNAEGIHRDKITGWIEISKFEGAN
nr:hypothetical protein [Tanacetum cinerariifolium]